MLILIILIIDTINKYLELIKQKELVYKEGCKCDSGMVEIRDVEQIFKDFAREIEAELVFKYLHKKD